MEHADLITYIYVHNVTLVFRPGTAVLRQGLGSRCWPRAVADTESTRRGGRVQGYVLGFIEPRSLVPHRGDLT